MGWLNAVSLFQHLQRRLSMGKWPVGAELPHTAEWRRDRPLPVRSNSEAQEWFQNYLDDFDAPLICSQSEGDKLSGKLSPMLLKKREANERFGIQISEKKSVAGLTQLERMGAYIDGDVGRVGLTSRKLFELCHFGIWLLSDLTLDCKGLAIFLGRLIRAFEFRRPLMGLLNDVWQYSNWEGRMVLRIPSITEMLISLCMCPLAYSDLRAQIDPRVTCSDASMSGGGMCISIGLSIFGERILDDVSRNVNSLEHALVDTPSGLHKSQACDYVRVLCVGLFDGLGA